MKKILLVFVIILFASTQSTAKYDVNNRCKDAWMLLMDLKIHEAKELLAVEIQQNPENYYAYYLLIFQDSKITYNSLNCHKNFRLIYTLWRASPEFLEDRNIFL